MEYRIRKTDDGFELSQVVPQIIGTFPDRGVAEKVMVLLSENGSEDSQKGEPETDEPETSAQIEDETAMAVALKRLAAGEKLKDVAEGVGIPWTRLRARWASEKRREATSEPSKAPAVTALPAVVRPRHDPVATFKAGAADALEMSTCDCGKRFTPSDPNQTQCARCEKV